MLKIVGLLPFAFTSQFSWAAIELFSVSNASGYTLEGTPMIYGGIAGTCSEVNGFRTCNSCTYELKACNRARIYDNLELHLRFKSTVGGRVRLVTADKSTLLATTFTQPDWYEYVSVRWADLCTKVGGMTNCETPFSNGSMMLTVDVDGDGVVDADEPQIVIGVQVLKPSDDSSTIDHCDANPVGGVCEFNVEAGNRKAFVTEAAYAPGFPSSGGNLITKLHFMYSKNGFGDVTPISDGQRLKLEVKDDGFYIRDNRITALENGTRYYFRVGTVDLAGNISNITSDTAIAALCGSVSAPTENCQFSTTPGGNR